MAITTIRADLLAKKERQPGSPPNWIEICGPSLVRLRHRRSASFTTVID
jgi:hypothetical protein